VKQVLHDLNLLFLVYFVFVNGFYLVLIGLSSREVRRYSRITAMTEHPGIFSTTFYKPVSVIVPAHNEAATIVHTVSSVLAVQYPELEVIVVNDGSTDSTLAELIASFDLVPSPGQVTCEVQCQAIRGIYESFTYPGLRVVDKEQGGKADALNAGINASTFPLVCNIDADSIIDIRSMVQITRPFLEDHRVVAVGGVVMPANGCDIDNGEVRQVGLSKSRLAVFQTVEYLRAFLFGRLGWSRLNSLLIVSGAFAIFRRTALVEVGGYCTDTVGEDMELVLRIHRVYAEKKKPYRIIFLPDPICWTQAPEDLKSLGRQRRRWHRGLAESLVKNRQLCLNPKYGGVGMVGYPFFVVCELLSPVVELFGYVIVVVAIAARAISWQFGIAITLSAILLGTVMSMSALLLEAKAFRKYPRVRDTLRLALHAVLEGFGYRQLHSFWRCMGLVDYLRKPTSWGHPLRKAF
jgi:cellulose synthase/poly-beta-1,6-N-acetylglucosamine synthase-like glycosyltransferase